MNGFSLDKTPRLPRAPRVALRCLVAMLLVLGARSAGALADVGLVRQQRLVHQFDFEDTDDQGQKLGHGHQWPRHWFGIGRSPQVADPNFHRQPIHGELIARHGYPNYTEVRFDSTRAASGEFSLYLGLNGGNAGSFLEVGALPVVPGSDYLITARVATDRLKRAGARLTAYFVDGQGRRIDASARHTEPIRTAGEWTTVAVKLPGDFSHAAWLGLEVQLLQPDPDPDAALGTQQVLLMDVAGDAWFDDITVWHVPHVEAASQSAVNIIQAPDRPRLTLAVRDLSGQALVADVTLYDHARRPAAHLRQPLPVGAPMRWQWTPALPGYGWYLVDMIVRDQDTLGRLDEQGDSPPPLARAISAVLWLPALAPLPGEEADRFSLIAEDTPDAQLRLLPELLDNTGIDRLLVSVWQRDTTLRTIEPRLATLDTLLEGITSSRRQLAMSLHPVPIALAEQQDVNSDHPLDVMRAPEAQWSPFLVPVVMRHGQRVGRWQLGTTRQAQGFFQPDLPAAMEQVAQRFHNVAPRAELLLPWRLDQQHRPGLPASVHYAMQVPPSIAADHLHDSLTAWRAQGAVLRLHLQVAGADQMAHTLRARDLALRMIQAWRSEPAGLSIASPWTTAMERREALAPDPLLGVFVNTAQRLAGRRVIGQIPLPEGLVCYVLDGPAGGMLAAWNHAADDGAELRMFLGNEPVSHDVWGNAAPLPMEDGEHVLRLSRTPVFVTGIEPELAMFRASFRIDPPLIRSTQEPHTRTLHLRNPWARTISGQFHIVGPANWDIQPAQYHFSIPAGGALALPMQLRMPVAEVAGPKTLTARFDFTADRHYQIQVGTPMELGLPDLDFQATVVLESGSAPGSKPDTEDAVVACIITNTGEQTRALYVFANLAGHPRQERIVAQLEPGQSVVRRFRFTDAGVEARQNPIRTGVRETNGPAVLNKLLELE